MSFDSKIHRPAYWWVEIEGIRKRFGHYLPSWNPDSDYDEDPEAHWWNFNGSTDRLVLPGADAAGFDPHLGTDDFTVAGYYQPANTSQNSGIFAKWKPTHTCWRVHQATNSIRHSISKDAGAVHYNVLAVADLAATTDSFFCGRYDYVADGTSDLFLQSRVNDDSNLNCYGPIYSTTSADVTMAYYDSGVDRYFNGRIYWLAYWPRKLSDAEVAALKNKTTLPYELYPDEIKYIDFSRAVAATYQLNIGNEVFTVYGTPSLGAA